MQSIALSRKRNRKPKERENRIEYRKFETVESRNRKTQKWMGGSAAVAFADNGKKIFVDKFFYERTSTSLRELDSSRVELRMSNSK